MIRIICKIGWTTPDGTHEGFEYRTFDVDIPELEEWMTGSPTAYEFRSAIGVEVYKVGEPDGD